MRQVHTSFTCQDLKENLSEETGLQQLQKDTLKHHRNPLIGYLNINSLRHKITDLRVIMKTSSLDFLILSDTKIDESFPTAQFNVKGSGGSLIEFVRRGLTCKRLRDYETKHCECLCFKLTFTNKKLICRLWSSNLSIFSKT